MKTNKFKIGGIRVGIVSMLIIAIFVVSMMPHPILEQTEDGKSWHVVWEGTLADLVRADEANPGAGASGILEVYIYPHDADPGTEYNENDSAVLRAASFGSADADAENIDIPHSSDFDIVVRVRGNKTHCFDGSDFIDSYLRVNISSDDLGIAPALSAMTGVITLNNSAKDYLWMNFYINNAGSGYSIIRDETAEITAIKFEAYY